MSRWKDIFKVLKKNGYDVYSPSQKTGECTKEYIVVSLGDRVSYLETSTDIVYYDIYLYTPLGSYSTQEDFIAKVKLSLKELYPTIKDTRNDTSGFVDDRLKAHVAKMVYSNYVKITNL